MKLKFLSLLLVFTLIGFGLTACSTEKEDLNASEKSFEEQLSENDWDVDVLCLVGVMHFDEGGIGTLSFSGQSVRFDYEVSNVTDDNKEADIIITNSGINQIDNQKVHAEITSNGLKVTYSGMNLVLKPVNPDTVE